MNDALIIMTAFVGVVVVSQIVWATAQIQKKLDGIGNRLTRMEKRIGSIDREVLAIMDGIKSATRPSRDH